MLQNKYNLLRSLFLDLSVQIYLVRSEREAKWTKLYSVHVLLYEHSLCVNNNVRWRAPECKEGPSHGYSV